MVKEKATLAPKEPKSSSKNSLPVYDQEGKEVGTFEFGKDFFDKNVNRQLLAQVVKVYQANSHQGTASVKTRGEVRGGGRKPWKQKGTGRARTGSIRGAQWRGGGIIFGPIPSDPGLKLTKKMRTKALMEALKFKIHAQAVILVNEINFKEIKTKVAANLMKNLPVKGRTLVLTSEKNEGVIKSFNNLPQTKTDEVRNLNAYDVLYHNNLLLTKDAAELVKAKFEAK